MDTPEKRAKAIQKLRASMTPVRNAYTHAARLDALARVQGMLFMLWTIEWVDRSTLEKLNTEILEADSTGTSRCEARLASGKISRCMDANRIHDRAAVLITLHEAVQGMRQAPSLNELDLQAWEFESTLMSAFPSEIDEDELVEWHVEVELAKSYRRTECS